VWPESFSLVLKCMSSNPTLQLTNFTIFNLKNIFQKIIEFAVFLNTSNKLLLED